MCHPNHYFFINRSHLQNLWKSFFHLSFFQSTGRRGTFLSEEQICNCAVVPSHNANGIKVKFFKKNLKSKSALLCKFFWRKRMSPFFRHIKKTYIYTCYLLASPPHKFLPAMKERRKQETIRKQPCQRTGKTCSRKSEDRYKDQTDQCAGNHLSLIHIWRCRRS